MSGTQDIQTLLSQTSWVRSLARRLVADPNAADDLAQATWLDALRRPPDPSRPIRGWLASVMRNNLGKQKRGDANREARDAMASRAEALPSTVEVVEKASTHKDVVLAVLALDEPYRSTLLMRYFEDLPYSDIAQRTGVTRATVNSRITRGLSLLRSRLEAKYGDRNAYLSALAPLALVPARATEMFLGAKTMTLMTGAATTVLAVATVTVVAGNDPQPSEPPMVGVEADVSLGAALIGDPAGMRREAIEPASTPEVAHLPIVLDGEADVDKEWKTDVRDSRPVPDEIKTLVVNLSSGDIELVPAAGANLEIDGVVRAQVDRVDSRLLTPHFDDHVTITTKDSTLKIEDKHKNERGWDVSLKIRVPKSLPLSLNSGSGDVLIKGYNGRINANTGSGDVQVSSEDPIVEMNLNTGSGDVQLDIASLAEKGALVANTGSGDVAAIISGAETKGKAVFNSGSGDVILRVPSGVTGTFELKSNTGDMSIDSALGLAIEEEKKDSIRARNASGLAGGVFKLSTGSGDVKLVGPAKSH